MKHTPGPWKFNHVGEFDIEVADQKGRLVCDLGQWDEQEANARLIAASPELLEGCKIALEAMENRGLWPTIQDKIKQAISKAERKL